MGKTLCTIVTGFSLISSTSFSKSPEPPKVDLLVKRVVELLKTNPNTDLGPQVKVSDGLVRGYLQKFRSGSETICVLYTDFKDEETAELRPQHQTEDEIGLGDVLLIYVSSNPERLDYHYSFYDFDLDGKINHYSEQKPKLDDISEKASQKRYPINQRYYDYLRLIEQRLLLPE